MEAVLNGGDALSVNWEGSAICKPEKVVRPRRVSDLIDIIKNSDAYPTPVRAFGFQHSTTRCGIADGGTLVDMRELDRVLEFGDGFVRVQAGIQLNKLVRLLEKRNMQLCACIEFGDVSAGSIACSSNRYVSSTGVLGQLSSTVTGMKLVTPQGTQLNVTSKQSDLLSIMRSSFGLMGIIYEVTFATREKIGFVSEFQSLTLDTLDEAVADVPSEGLGARMTIFPFKEKVNLELRQTVEIHTGSRQWLWRMRTWSWNCLSPLIAQCFRRAFSSNAMRGRILDAIHAAAQVARSKLLQGRVAEMPTLCLSHCRLPKWSRGTYTTWAFPAKIFTQVLEKYFQFSKAYLDRNDFRCDLPATAVFIPRDRSSLMSYASQCDMYTLDVFSSGGDGWEDFLVDLNEFCSKNGGIPLLNQTKLLTHRQAMKAIGKNLTAFSRLRMKVDPENRLTNTFFQPLIG